MNIKISSEEELIKVATEALHILSNMRRFQKAWEQDFGVELKTRKKWFEKRADDFLAKLQVPDHSRIHEIKIEIE